MAFGSRSSRKLQWRRPNSAPHWGSAEGGPYVGAAYAPWVTCGGRIAFARSLNCMSSATVVSMSERRFPL